MTVSEAWLLDLNESLLLAIGDHEMVEYLQDPVTYSVPGAPRYCNQLIVWQGNLAPVMDIVDLLQLPADGDSRLMSLVAFQQQPRSPLEYLAFKIRIPPRKIQVDDEQVRELSEEISEGPLGPLCLSCFDYETRPALLLNLAKLCSKEYRDLINTN